MIGVGERQNGAIHPSFDRSISIDFKDAKITSDTGFVLMRQIDERFKLLEPAASGIDDPRSPRHTDHSLLQLLRQRVYQVAAGYEDCHFRLNPLTLTGGKRAIILRGWRRLLKSKERISLRYLLQVPSENRMVFTSFRVSAGVFRAKIRSQYAVWMHSAEVDALFRFWQ